MSNNYPTIDGNDKETPLIQGNQGPHLGQPPRNEQPVGQGQPSFGQPPQYNGPDVGLMPQFAGGPDLGTPPSGYQSPQPQGPYGNPPTGYQAPPPQGPYGTPPTGYQSPPPQGPYGTPPTGYQAPPPQPQPAPTQPIIPPPVEEDSEPFKIKGVVELQKEFGAEEVKIVKKQPHVCSLLINILLLISRGIYLTILIGYQISYNNWYREVKLIREGWWIFALVELIHFIEYTCSSTLRYLWNKTDCDSIKNYVIKMKNTRPSISMWCECFHYETRIRYVTENYTVNGPNGPETRTRQRVETYQEKVVTHTETEYFDFTAFLEISQMISDDIYNNDLIKIKFSERIEFGDMYTRSAYDNQLSRFISRNKHRDVCFSYTENKNIPGFKERMFSVNGEAHSCFMTWYWYSLVTLLGFTWPFRIWVEKRCVRGEFGFRSIVFRDPRMYGY